MKLTAYYLTIILLSFSFAQIWGQQPVQYSLNSFNKYSFNAAYAGLDESLSATGVFRKQWSGLQGSPTSQNLSVHLPLYYLNGAVGISIENDALGAERNLNISAAYAYQQTVGDGTLSAGIRAGVFQKTIDGTLLFPRDQDQLDNVIPIGIATTWSPIVDAGIYFKHENFEVGISASSLLGNSADFTLNQPVSIEFLRNYFFIFAYNFEIGTKLEATPSVFVKSDWRETQLDVSATFRYNDNILFGASFRGYNAKTIDATVLMAGMEISPNITLLYAYDLSLSEIRTTNSGSHEILLNYNLNRLIGGGRPPKIIYNPRFL